MNKVTESFFDNQEIKEIAKVLANYGLGIFYPHKHVNGGIVALPPCEIVSERDLVVSFIPKTEAGKDEIPVGWRWNGVELEVCGSCCVAQSPPPPSPPPPLA